MSSTWTRWTLAIACMATGCGDDGAPAVDAGVADATASCLEATMHSDLEWIQDEILTPGCARFTACHQGRALSAAELNLEEGESRDNMVGVASELFPDYDLVVPGDPENSYLMIILGHYDGPVGEGGLMPYNNPLLCPEKLEAIDRWIEAGAMAGGGSADAGVADAAASDATP
jgi:hypothetical protein